MFIIYYIMNNELNKNIETKTPKSSIFFHWSLLLFVILISSMTYVKMLENNFNLVQFKIIMLSIVVLFDFFLSYSLSKYNKSLIKFQDIIKDTFVIGLCILTSI